MIARFVTVSTLVLGLTSFASAQESAPAPDDAPVPSAVVPSEAIPAPPAAARSAAVIADPKDYRIGPEDVLDFAVWKNPELTRDRVPVRPDGKVSLPLVNDIRAAGLTANELRAELAERLAPFIQNPEVAVIVREVNSVKVSVQGNVRMPGQYLVKSGDQTVLEMLSRAQGLTEFANKGNIVVIRRNGVRQERMKFDYGDATEGKDGANFFVQPGDIIIVN